MNVCICDVHVLCSVCIEQNKCVYTKETSKLIISIHGNNSDFSKTYTTLQTKWKKRLFCTSLFPFIQLNAINGFLHMFGLICHECKQGQPDRDSNASDHKPVVGGKYWLKPKSQLEEYADLLFGYYSKINREKRKNFCLHKNLILICMIHNKILYKCWCKRH